MQSIWSVPPAKMNPQVATNKTMISKPRKAASAVDVNKSSPLIGSLVLPLALAFLGIPFYLMAILKFISVFQ